MDFPDVVDRLMLLDIAPTLAMYEAIDRAFATAYFHWFFLIQSAPLPEELIGGNTDAYIDRVMGNPHAGLAAVRAPRVASVSRRADVAGRGAWHVRGLSRVGGHRSGTRSRGHRARPQDRSPLRVLCGEEGVIARCFDALAELCKVARDVSGRALPCRHYIAEEKPELLLDEIFAFFKGDAS